jgi:hypothetical protein
MICARIVLIKGLLPQLLFTLMLLGAFERYAPVVSVAIAAIPCALIAGVAVAALLLPASLPKLPAVQYEGTWNFVATVLQMTAVVTVATLAPRLLLRKRG